MDDFSYLSVVTSIVLGLGVTQLLAGVARLVQSRQRVRLYAPTLLWTALLFLLHIQLWWSAAILRDVESWTFLGFFVTILLPTLAYLLSVLALPDFDREGTIDLRQVYYENSRWFFGVLTLLVLLSFVRELVLDGSIDRDADTAFKIVFTAMSIAAAATSRRIFHESWAPIAFLAFVVYIGTLFPNLATID